MRPALRPPAVPDGGARLRLTVMASHTKAELREAAHVLARAALRTGWRPSAGVPVAAAPPSRQPAVFDGAALPRAA